MDVIQERFGEHALELVIWIQYNDASRSPAFHESIAELHNLGTTILVVNASRPGRRLDNYGVSGALVPQEALASEHSLLVKRFHYVEPIHESLRMSRIVLLRSDADAYRVSSALAGPIVAAGGVAKGALFQESEPYIYSGGHLSVSPEPRHLTDLCQLAVAMAQRATSSAASHIAHAADALVSLGTSDFLACLDLVSPPRQFAGHFIHRAGERHRVGGQGADFRCACWTHRECVDRIGDNEHDAEPLAQFLSALGAMRARGLNVVPAMDVESGLNTRLELAGRTFWLGVVYAGDYNATAIRRLLERPERPRLVASRYIILGTGDAPARMPLSEVRAGIAARQEFSQGSEALPALRALFERDFWQGYENGTLGELVGRLVQK